MNFVERNTWHTIQHYLKRTDPARQGWAIDVGIGDDDYYFEWLSVMGYRTLAIEPVPTERARRALAECDVPLIEVALSDRDGQQAIYTARGIHSLVSGLWGEAEAARSIQTITWKTLMDEHRIEQITVLKLDIEGAEGIVLRQLYPELLPDVVSFEFGGVWDRRSGAGPWSDERYAALIENIRRLDALGYDEAVMVSSGDDDRAHYTHLSELATGDLFEPTCNWGNLITIHERIGGAS